MHELLYILYSIGLIIAIICMICIGLQKPSYEQKQMLIISNLAFILSLGYWFAIQSTTVEASILAYKLMYFGACNLHFVILLFFIRYYQLKAPRFLLQILGFFCAILTIFALTMDKHQLFYKSYYFAYENGVPVLIKQYGVFHSLYIFLEIGISIVLIAIVIYQSTKHTEKEKWEDLFLLGVPVMPSALHIFMLFSPTKIDLISIGILFSEILLVILIYKLKIYDINDTARQLIIDSLEDAIVVVDKIYRYKGSNEQAVKLFHELLKAPPDMKLEQVSDRLFQMLKSKDTKLVTINDKKYKPNVKIIKKENQIKGYVIWCLDVTDNENQKKLIANYQKNLEAEVAQKTVKLEEIQEQIIISFANIVESRDTVTGEHVKRTSIYVRKIAEELLKEKKYKELVNDRFIKYMNIVAPLHDIGKITVSDSILNKPYKLSEDEFNQMKKHAEKGGKILRDALAMIDDIEYFNMAYDVAVYHHEKWNGEGYPEGLSGNQIPLSARIMAIADVFDALTSSRIYKAAYSYEKSFKIIQEESGRHFDPVLVDLFLKIRPEIEQIAAQFNTPS